MILATIKVKREGGKGFRIINASDFKPSLHQLWTEEQAGQASQPLADAQIVPAAQPKKGKRK